MNTFWQDFYHDTYQKYALQKNKDVTNNCFRRLANINQVINGMEVNQVKIKGVCLLIEKDLKDPLNNTSQLQELLNELNHMMDSYIQDTNIEIKKIEKPLWSIETNTLSNRIHRTIGDGNCFFYALANEIARKRKGNISAAELREKGVAFLEQNKELLEQHPPENETIEHYLKRMKLNAVWAEGAIIDAVAMSLDIHIQIYDIRRRDNGYIETKNVININEYGARGTIHLILINNHYDALELHNEKELELTIRNNYFLEIASNTNHLGIINFAYKDSKTIVHFDNKKLNTIEHAIKLLMGDQGNGTNASSLVFNTYLLQRPQKFYSELQEEIYIRFLNNYHYIVNLYPVFATFHGISMNTNFNLVVLYQRINAVMNFIYYQDQKFSELEIQLIDLLLCNAVERQFECYQWENLHFVHQPPKIEFKNADSQIQLSIDLHRLNHGDFFEHLNKNFIDMKEKDDLISGYISRVSELECESMSKNDIVASKERIIQELKQENAKNKERNKELHQDNERLEQELYVSYQENARLTQDRNAMAQENAQLLRQLALKEAEVQNFARNSAGFNHEEATRNLKLMEENKKLYELLEYYNTQMTKMQEFFQAGQGEINLTRPGISNHQNAMFRPLQRMEQTDNNGPGLNR